MIAMQRAIRILIGGYGLRTGMTEDKELYHKNNRYPINFSSLNIHPKPSIFEIV
jgi:hypothetical protein